MSALPDQVPHGGPTPNIRARAVEWFVLLASGSATDQDRKAWASWRAAHAAHEAEWTRIERVQGLMLGMPAEVATTTLRRSGAPRRRHILRSIAAATTVGVLGYGSWRGATSPMTAALLADARTASGEQRQITLPDGSLVTLNTATALDIRYDADWRALTLLDGEILVETAAARGTSGAADPRPLVIDTRWGRVRALGTRFMLRQDDAQLTVAVLQSAVEARTPTGLTQRVNAGQQLIVNTHGYGPLTTLSPEADAWTYGSLIVDNARLGDVVAELARYRRGHLGCDARAANLRVSGAFPVQDIDQALAALAAALPVRVDQTTRFWTNVRLRGA